MGSTGFRNTYALSSAHAALGLLQPRAFGFLNPVHVVPLVSLFNLYIGKQLLDCSVYQAWSG